MKDWEAIARANGLNVSARDLDRIAQPLAALEEIFTPLIEGLTPDDEPASDFHMEDE